MDYIKAINWLAIEAARKESPLTTQWFVTKHTVGMCRVGKFLKHWKESETYACP